VSAMSIIEQAARRLEELSRAGVSVPWTAAGLSGPGLQKHAEIISSEKQQKVSLPLAGGTASSMPGVDGVETIPLHATREHEAVTLDLEHLMQGGHLVPTESRSALAEEFRHIKRPLLRNARGMAQHERKSLIMVTSALPGEGKTFCAINLAMSMALEMDTSVLLVDADVVRPDVNKRLGLAPRKGFLDVLTEGKLDLDDVMFRTNVPKLSILPAGTYNNRTTELLASDAMNVLLGELTTRYRDTIVVFDAPPLLVTSEAKVLATRVGQVVLVVEASRTPLGAIERAFSALEQCSCVMSVLNKGKDPVRSYGYGDYYG